MPHALARAFQHTGGVQQHGAMEKSDACISLEGVDIAERRILHASDRTSVMKDFPHIRAQAAHALKPGAHRQAVRIGEIRKPRLDLGITADRIVEPKDLVHFYRSAIPLVPRRSKPATRNFSSAFSSTFRPRPGYCGTMASPFSKLKGCSPCKMGR